MAFGLATLKPAWAIARREMRAGLKGFRVFLACLSLGVAAIAAVGSLSHAVTAGLEADGRRLLGGDMDMRTQHLPAEPDQLAYLEANTSRVSLSMEMKAMAQTPDARALVELKAVDQAYPMVGLVTLAPAQDLQGMLAKQNDVWGAAVEKGLLVKLGIVIGDTVRVGEAAFQVRAVIEQEPDRIASVVNFGPRFMVSEAALPDTGLVQLGSQIHYHYRLLLNPKVKPLAFEETLNQTFPEAGWRIRTPDSAAPGVENFLERLTQFLSFAGFTALLVGGIGVLGAVKSYLDTKTATIATLKCLGAPGALVFQAYLLQVLALGLLGTLIGLIAGVALPYAAVGIVKDYLPIQPQVGLYAQPLLQAATFGMLVALTFSLWPLGQARETPAANLFRGLVAPSSKLPRPSIMAAAIAGLFLLAGLVILWGEHKNLAAWFVAVSAVTVLLLRLGAVAVMAAARHAPRPASAVLRLVLANLHRPGTATPGVVLSMGIGLSVLVGVASIQANLAEQINERIPDQAPAFFFIDIQTHQAQAFAETVNAVPGAFDLRQVPSLRGRIVKINGVPVEDAEIDPDVQWAVRGDRALTYAAEPSDGTQFVAGEWWDENYSGPPLISFDARVAKGFGVGVGDSLTINVLGREITAEIASLRDIDWRTLRFDFAIIFAPGALEGAPHTFLAAVNAPPEAEDEIERRVAQGFTNISAIRVRDALQAASDMMSGISGAVRAIASVTVVAGIIVLAGTIAAGHARRVYSSVVFKVLGATRAQVLGAFILEYGTLGLLTGFVAAIVGTLIGWAVIVHLMHLSWSFYLTPVLVTLAGAILLTAAAGFIGTWRAMGETAAKHLRNE